MERLDQELSSPVELLEDQADQNDADREVVSEVDDDPEEVDELHGVDEFGVSDEVERLLEELFTSLLTILHEWMIHVLVQQFHDDLDGRSHPLEQMLVQLRGGEEDLVVDEGENIEDDVGLVLIIYQETHIQDFLFVGVLGFFSENPSQTFYIELVSIPEGGGVVGGYLAFLLFVELEIRGEVGIGNNNAFTKESTLHTFKHHDGFEELSLGGRLGCREVPGRSSRRRLRQFRVRTEL